jgi:hypothetical protein
VEKSNFYESYGYFPGAGFRVRHAKSAGKNSLVIREKSQTAILYSNQFVSLVIIDTIIIHTAIKSGTFGEHLTSEWRCQKCRIYEINRIESPNLYEENAGKIQTSFRVIQVLKIRIGLDNCYHNTILYYTLAKNISDLCDEHKSTENNYSSI